MFTDDLGQQIEISKFPQRVVSLVPSLTELLIHLGIGDRLVGRTKFCINPKAKVRSIQKIGGTKTPHIDIIQSLNPDLVIANKEENNLNDIESIRKFCPGYTTKISTIDEALQSMTSLSSILNLESETAKLVNQIKSLLPSQVEKAPIKIIYLIWQDPYMTIGGDTYINDLLKINGFINVYENEKRYPEITLEDMMQNEMDCILLSSEPFPFKEKHGKDLMDKTNIKTILVDGEMCSWYGSKMLEGIPYLQDLYTSLKKEKP